MTTLMEQEKQRISERLARLDAEREKLSGQLEELEIGRTCSGTIRGKGGYNREATESTPGKNYASGRWGAQRPKQTESARRFDQRRQFEGRTGV